MERYIAYLRVSTQRQGASGLGIDAQRQRITEFVGNGEVVEWFEEHESGAKSDRPQLEKALNLCELTGNNLVIATLDRLSRDVLFLETIKRRCASGNFQFRCADMPDADSFVLGIMAQVAEYEVQKIRERTKAALQAARARGVRLGNPNGALNFVGKREIAAKHAGEVHKAKADKWAEKRRDLIERMVATGLSNKGIARELAVKKITTRRMGKWTATGVQRLKNRLESLAVPLYALVVNE